jgi:uncharacterized protein
MGGSPEAVPRAVLEGVVDRYVDVLEALVSEPPEVAPVFWETHDGHVIAKDWCEGFVRAVGLRPRAWVSLTKSGSHAALMTPILSHLLDEEGEILLDISRQKRSGASGATAEDLPAAVLGIHQFWSR